MTFFSTIVLMRAFVCRPAFGKYWLLNLRLINQMIYLLFKMKVPWCNFHVLLVKTACCYDHISHAKAVNKILSNNLININQSIIILLFHIVSIYIRNFSFHRIFHLYISRRLGVHPFSASFSARVSSDHKQCII